MLLSILISLILVLIPYVSSLSPLSLTKPVTDGFGVNIHFTHPKDGELEMLAGAGFKWVRKDIDWDSIEREKGKYNFTEYEFLLNELAKHNISAYFILDYGNTLYDKPKAVITEEGRKAYARWAAASVEHFKGRGIVWEIWNEPNIGGFWNGSPDVQQYIAMALEAVKTIKGKTPDEIIIGPASASIDLSYLEECFKSGLLNYWDAVSVHPYRQSGPETVSIEYFELKKLLANYAPKGKTIPIISGEWGYSSVWNNFNDSIQGKYLPRELLINVMNGISISIWYDWHNDGINKSDAEHNFGTVQFEYDSGAKLVYKPKDSYLSAKTISSSLNGFQFVKRITTNDSKDYVLLFKNENYLRLAVWTTSSVEHQITIPSDKCDFEITHSKGDKIEKTSAKDGSVTLTVNQFPHYILFKGPNNAMESSSDGNLIRATIEPINGKHISVIIYNLNMSPLIGSIQLTNITGVEALESELKFEFTNESEKRISFPLKSKLINEYTIGVNIKCNDSDYNIKPHKYVFQPNQVLFDAKISPDGDPNVPSNQSLSVQSAPEPLLDSDTLSVLKIDYQFYGKGWKFLNVNPNASDSKISGEPTAFGLWIYGDKQFMTIKMRISDATHQGFQLVSEFHSTINWKGWRFVRISITDVDSYWGGSKDGKVHYPVEYQTLLLIDNQKQSNIESNIYITSPIIIY